MRFYLCLAVTLAFAILLTGCMKAATHPEDSTTAVNARQAPSLRTGDGDGHTGN